MAVEATSGYAGAGGQAANERALARVLIVDDRYDNVLALEASLQGMPVRPVRALSGEEALKRLLVDDFALILLDVQMPEMDGFETAQHIKRRERTRHIPIIFLTAADREAQLALRGYATGAVDYITKPFDPWILRAKVAIFVDLWAKTQRLKAHVESDRAHESDLAAVAGLLEEAAVLADALVATTAATTVAAGAVERCGPARTASATGEVERCGPVDVPQGLGRLAALVRTAGALLVDAERRDPSVAERSVRG